MGSDIEFTVSSWRRAGAAYEEAGTELIQSVQQHLASLSIDQVGCNAGEHVVDQALALILPPVLEAFIEVCSDRGENMQETGQAMIETADAYQSTEDAAVSIAQGIIGSEA